MSEWFFIQQQKRRREQEEERQKSLNKKDISIVKDKNSEEKGNGWLHSGRYSRGVCEPRERRTSHRGLATPDKHRHGLEAPRVVWKDSRKSNRARHLPEPTDSPKRGEPPPKLKKTSPYFFPFLNNGERQKVQYHFALTFPIIKFYVFERCHLDISHTSNATLVRKTFWPSEFLCVATTFKNLLLLVSFLKKMNDLFTTFFTEGHWSS